MMYSVYDVNVQCVVSTTRLPSPLLSGALTEWALIEWALTEWLLLSGL